MLYVGNYYDPDEGHRIDFKSLSTNYKNTIDLFYRNMMNRKIVSPKNQSADIDTKMNTLIDADCDVIVITNQDEVELKTLLESIINHG